LASQRLTRSGQGETDYRYFELFLESVSSFPSIALCLSGYHLQCPAILQQSLATLFPYLEKLRDHLLRGDSALPFSGSARSDTPSKGGGKGKNKKGNRPRQQQPQRQLSHPLQRTARWSPQGPVAFSASSDSGLLPTSQPSGYDAHIFEMQEIRAMLATMTASPVQGLYNGMRFLLTNPLPPPSRLAPRHVAIIAGSMGGIIPTMETLAMLWGRGALRALVEIPKLESRYITLVRPNFFLLLPLVLLVSLSPHPRFTHHVHPSARLQALKTLIGPMKTTERTSCKRCPSTVLRANEPLASAKWPAYLSPVLLLLLYPHP
jgi:hypothetical protein